MTPETFNELVKIFTLPTAMCVVAVIAFVRRWIVPWAAYKDMMDAKDQQIKDAKDGESEMWGIVKPTLQVANRALEKERASVQ